MLKKPAFRYAIAFLLSVGALYLAFRKQNLSDLLTEISRVNVLILIAGTGVMFLSHLVRAWRYKMFLRPVAPHASVISCFKALIAGYAMNNVIPRSGDVVRPVMLSKTDDVDVSSTIAALLVERLSDMIGLCAVTIVSLFIFREEIAIAFPALFEARVVIIGVLFLMFVLGLLIMFSERKTGRVLKFIGKGLPARFRQRIERGVHSLEEGIREARVGAAVPVIAGTLGIWFLYSLSMWISLHAFPEHSLREVGFRGSVLLQTMSGIAFTIPTPGGTGTYHFFISESLMTLFSVDKHVAFAYATLTHAANFILTTLVGIIFMVSEGVSIREVRKTSREEKGLLGRTGDLAKSAHVPDKFARSRMQVSTKISA